MLKATKLNSKQKNAIHRSYFSSKLSVSACCCCCCCWGKCDQCVLVTLNYKRLRCQPACFLFIILVFFLLFSYFFEHDMDNCILESQKKNNKNSSLDNACCRLLQQQKKIPDTVSPSISHPY